MTEREGLADRRQEAEALDGVLADLETRSTAFGAALTGALKGAAVEGRGLEDVLRRTGERLSAMALSAALKPLEGLIGGTVSTALSALTGGAGASKPTTSSSGLSSAAGASIFSASGLAAPQILTRALAGPASVSSGSERGDAGAAERTGGGGGPSSGPSITFHVTTPDAESFRKSEGQIAAMLTRAVGRGRRGL